MVGPDGLQHCLLHAPCIADFRLFKPKDCAPCRVTVAVLHDKCNLMITYPKLVVIRWADLVRFCHQHGWTPSWADSDLPILLGLNCSDHQPPSPVLQLLLVEPVVPEETFPGFASDYHEAIDTQHLNTTPPIPARMETAPLLGPPPSLVPLTSDGREVEQ